MIVNRKEYKFKKGVGYYLDFFWVVIFMVICFFMVFLWYVVVIVIFIVYIDSLKMEIEIFVFGE